MANDFGSSYFLEFLSCVAYSQAQVWWNKGHSYHLASIANVINQASDPLVIYPVPAQYLAPNIGVLARVMPLVYLLDPKVKFQFVVDSNQFPEIASNSREIFAYRPTEKIRQWLEEDLQFRLEPAQEHTIYKKTWLWKLSF